MRRSPEVTVSRLRNRKGRIIGYGILSVILAGMAAGHWVVLTKLITGLAPREGEDLLLHVVIGQQMLGGITCLQTILFLLALGFGATVAGLIAELTTFTKNDLLVHLWDRVQALEQLQPSPANSQQPQPPPAADKPGG